MRNVSNCFAMDLHVKPLYSTQSVALAVVIVDEPITSVVSELLLTGAVIVTVTVCCGVIPLRLLGDTVTVAPLTPS